MPVNPWEKPPKDFGGFQQLLTPSPSESSSECEVELEILHECKKRKKKTRSLAPVSTANPRLFRRSEVIDLTGAPPTSERRRNPPPPTVHPQLRAAAASYGRRGLRPHHAAASKSPILRHGLRSAASARGYYRTGRLPVSNGQYATSSPSSVRYNSRYAQPPPQVQPPGPGRRRDPVGAHGRTYRDEDFRKTPLW